MFPVWGYPSYVLSRCFSTSLIVENDQVLHDGYLRTGVPGWGNAYEYAAVSQTDPQSIMNFLRTRAEEQVS